MQTESSNFLPMRLIKNDVQLMMNNKPSPLFEMIRKQEKIEEIPENLKDAYYNEKSSKYVLP